MIRGGVMNIAEAVKILYDISRKLQPHDGELARDIQICAEKLRVKKDFLDEDDMAEIRRAT
jgi:hypothetical protein